MSQRTRISSLLALFALFSTCVLGRSVPNVGNSRSKRTVDSCDSPFVRRLLEDVSNSRRYPTCNDGSPSGFYLQRPSIESTTWVLYLEGGEFCTDPVSCASRQLEPGKTSSSNWGLVKIPGSTSNQGILSSNIRVNPYLHSANKVYLPYCSSDGWSGTQTLSNVTDGGLVFSGARIFRAIIADLIQREGLATASRIILSGSSAGGIGVLLHIDYLRRELRNAGAMPDLHVQGIMDSAWYAHNPNNCTANFTAEARSRNCLSETAIGTLESGYRLWNGYVPETCSHARTKPWLCYIASVLRPSVQSDIFVFQWYFDSYFTKLTGVADALQRGAVLNKVQYYNAAQKILSLSNMVRKSMAEQKSLNGTFQTIVVLPTCFSHANLLLESWTSPMPYGSTLSTIVECHSRNSRANADALFRAEGSEDLNCGKKKRAFYRHMCRNPLVEYSSCPMPVGDQRDFYSNFRLAISQIPGVTRHCNARAISGR